VYIERGGNPAENSCAPLLQIVDFRSMLSRRGGITNWQVARIMDGNHNMISQVTDYKDLSDEHLILHLELGDQEAMTVLYQRFQHLIFSISNRILRDPGEAEDMVQEIFLMIHRKATLFDPRRGSVKVWILNYVFKRTFSRRRYLAHLGIFQLPVKPNEQERLRIEDQKEIMTKALSEVRPNHRIVLELVLFNGLSLREVAERLNERYQTVRNRYYRGCGKLRNVVERLIDWENELTKCESKVA